MTPSAAHVSPTTLMALRLVLDELDVGFYGDSTGSVFLFALQRYLTTPDRSAQATMELYLGSVPALESVLRSAQRLYDYPGQGHDPCDGWDPSIVLNLPGGLWWDCGVVYFFCRGCGEDKPWLADYTDYSHHHPHNLCGGSPRCCP